MTTRSPIICGVDGSPGSRRAALMARTLSEELRCPLELVHVVPPRPPMPLAAVPVAGHPVATAQMAELDRTESDAAFASVADELAGMDAEHITVQGHAPDRLSAIAETRDARLIAVGTRGTGTVRSALLGSVSRELAAQAPRPVLVVPEAAGGRIGPGPVVCGVDGSDGALAAARVAARMADDLHTALTIVAVLDPDAALDDLAAGIAAAVTETTSGEHVERLAVSGDPAGELARAAADRNAALLVVGSRGRGPVRAALLGSVSTAAIQLARCPVLIVPPRAASRR